jgi:hypothetical protein
MVGVDGGSLAGGIASDPDPSDLCQTDPFFVFVSSSDAVPPAYGPRQPSMSTARVLGTPDGSQSRIAHSRRSACAAVTAARVKLATV